MSLDWYRFESVDAGAWSKGSRSALIACAGVILAVHLAQMPMVKSGEPR
jgi:hypothetical protein